MDTSILYLRPVDMVACPDSWAVTHYLAPPPLGGATLTGGGVEIGVGGAPPGINYSSPPLLLESAPPAVSPLFASGYLAYPPSPG